MNRLLTPIVVFAMLVASACTDSDDYVFDESEKTEISVSACVTKSFDESSERVKSMVVVPGDSVIFISNIEPSKSVRNQEIFWTLDGKIFASEYTFRSAVYDAGTHKVAFTLVDFFGDSISDTVTLFASFPPTLSSENIIPAESSQNIPPNEPVAFAWNTNLQVDDDSAISAWDVSYHLVLESVEFDSSESTLVDTLIKTPYFTYYGKLLPLTGYRWTVSAANELGQNSADSIEGRFFTAGESDENAVLISVRLSSGEKMLSTSADLYPVDSYTKIFGTTFAGSSAYVKPIHSGDYRLVVSTNDYTDYRPDTLPVHLAAGQVLVLDTVFLLDKYPPSIATMGLGDTLDIADTLRFYVRDGGGSLSLGRIHVSLDGVNLSNLKYSHDTLSVPLTIDSSWSVRLLYISVTDLSGNFGDHQFYLRPNAELGEVVP